MFYKARGDNKKNNLTNKKNRRSILLRFYFHKQTIRNLNSNWSDTVIHNNYYPHYKYWHLQNITMKILKAT